MSHRFRPLVIALESLLLVVGLWMALLQITWLWTQVAPDQVRAWLSWVSDGRVEVARIELPHNLLIPAVTVRDLKVRWAGITFQAHHVTLDVRFENAQVRPALSVSQWQLAIKPHERSSTSFDVEQLQRQLTSAYPYWPIPFDQVSLKAGLVRYGPWQAVLPSLNLVRMGRVLAGESQLLLVYDRTLVWQGALTLAAQLDWRQRIISGTFDWRMDQPTRLVDLSPVLQTYWRKGVLRLDGAVRYQQGQPNMTIQVRFDRLDIVGPTGDGIDNLGAVLAWREVKGQRTFVIERWMINDKMLVNQAPAMVVLGENQLAFHLPHFRLESFKPALQALWPQWDWTKTHFSVDNLQLRYQLKPLRLQAASGRVNILAWPARENWPGLALRDLRLDGVTGRLALILQSPLDITWHAWSERPRTQLVLPPTIELVRQEMGWRLKPLSFRLGDMGGVLHWQGDRQTGALTLNLQPKTLQQVKRFLPYGLMDDALAQWLRQALVAGDVGAVEMRYAGAWASMFKRNSGLQISASLDKGVLRFQPDWPALEQMRAQVHFRPFELRVDLDQARMKGLKVGAAEAQIGPLDGKNVALRVKGRAEGAAEQAQALILDSPLLRVLSLQDILGERLTLSDGQMNTDLKLWIPLHGFAGKKIDADVKIRLKGVQVGLPGDLAIKSLDGQVHIAHLKQVRGALQGRLFDKPLNLKVNGTGDDLSFDVKGQLPLSPYLADVDGWLMFDGQLKVPMRVENAGLRFRVQGHAQLHKNHLPAPLDELIQQPLTLEGTWHAGQLQASLLAGEKLWASGHWEQRQGRLLLQQAQVLIGEAPEVVHRFQHHPPAQNLTVSIVAHDLDFARWMNWWFKQRQNLSVSAEAYRWPPLVLAIRAHSIRYGVQHFDQLAFTAFTLEQQRLGLMFQARQAEIAGILIPDTNQLVLIARRLSLHRPAVSKQNVCVAWQRPTDFKVFFIGQKVSLGRYLFDKLRFNLYEDLAQLRLGGIQAQALDGKVRFTGGLEWRYQENVSQLDARFESKDVKKFLDWAGFKNAGFRGERAVVDVRVDWIGAPDCISLKKLQGQVRFRLDDGVIEQAKPGLAKVFALLSVDSLLRNIKVTLGTLQYKGMVYDKIEGDVRLRKGWGHVKRIFLDAPALQADLKGGVDLVRRRFDLKAKVTPQIGGALTTLVSILGLANPVTAVGTYLFLKGIPGANPNLISYHYRIVGPWDHPRIINTDTGEVVGERKPDTSEQGALIEPLLDQ